MVVAFHQSCKYNAHRFRNGSGMCDQQALVVKGFTSKPPLQQNIPALSAAHLVEFTIPEARELCHDVEPDVEERVENEYPAVEGRDGELKNALKHLHPSHLSQRNHAIGNGRLHVLLRDDKQHADKRHEADEVPACH